MSSRRSSAGAAPADKGRRAQRIGLAGVTDPYLQAHRLAERAYLASHLTPISLRDQVLRGATLVARLLQSGEIAPDRPLLVAGAGAAGVTAALAAVRAGVPAMLFEASNDSLALQRFAGSRFIDPAVYDWPVDHWGSRLLRHGGSVPLPFAADYASRLASQWMATLQAQAAAPATLLTCYWGAAAIGIATIQLPDTTLGTRVVLDGVGSFEGGALIWATGDKQEDTAIAGSGFTGRPFWGPDDLTMLGAGARVLVSGAGDGALQDALRALTGRDDMGYLLRDLDIDPAAAALVQSAEDRAHRIRVWLPAGGSRANCFRELDDVHRDAVNIALAAPRLRTTVDATLAAGRPMVCVVHRQPWLTAYYGLNRFLALLFDRFLRNAGRDPLLYPGATIAGVTASAASGWDVSFNGTAAPPAGRFDRVVVRHGYKDMAPIPLPAPLIRNHLLPYHCP
ncbi:hypothetical protein [Falsiroseomonas sp. HW251]|uniref:hypothetical protein n=1 Tax=Falsiroseomonas sp. HW251 TaxID=3390998 RepID=UPI003D320A54